MNINAHINYLVRGNCKNRCLESVFFETDTALESSIFIFKQKHKKLSQPLKFIFLVCTNKKHVFHININVVTITHLNFSCMSTNVSIRIRQKNFTSLDIA